MRRISLMLAAFAALFAVPAAAQCTWGCMCQGSACGCNSNGSGSSCATGGSGCVVYKCGAEEGPLVIAPDGSAARPRPLDGSSRPLAGPALFALAVNSRWEYRSPGRSLARHCSGVVVARYLDHAAAAALRRRQRTLMI